MPFTFRTEPSIDDPTVQSIFYGPILLAVESQPVGDDLESGLLEFSFYNRIKLDGDLAAAMEPADRPMHFTSNGYSLAPFYEADPEGTNAAPEAGEGGGPRRGPTTQPYHIYVRRREPAVVFGSVDAQVANPVRDDGLTFLDAVWSQAPFQSHEQFVATVERVSTEWQGAGLLTESQGTAVVDAARRAEADLAA